MPFTMYLPMTLGLHEQFPRGSEQERILLDTPSGLQPQALHSDPSTP